MVKLSELIIMIADFRLEEYEDNMEIVVKNRTQHSNESINAHYDAVRIDFEITKDKQQLIVYI